MKATSPIIKNINSIITANTRTVTAPMSGRLITHVSVTGAKFTELRDALIANEERSISLIAGMYRTMNSFTIAEQKVIKAAYVEIEKLAETQSLGRSTSVKDAFAIEADELRRMNRGR